MITTIESKKESFRLWEQTIRLTPFLINNSFIKDVSLERLIKVYFKYPLVASLSEKKKKEIFQYREQKCIANGFNKILNYKQIFYYGKKIKEPKIQEQDIDSEMVSRMEKALSLTEKETLFDSFEIWYVDKNPEGDNILNSVHIDDCMFDKRIQLKELVSSTPLISSNDPIMFGVVEKTASLREDSSAAHFYIAHWGVDIPKDLIDKLQI